MKVLNNINSIIFLMAACLTTTGVFSQNPKDSTNQSFHDDLLEHLVGKWNITSFAHGNPFTGTLEAQWILHHQYLRVHYKGNEPMPSPGIPVEYEQYIGYNHKQHHYIVNGLSVEGSDDFEGFCYAYREGNQLRLMQKLNDTVTTIVQRMILEPESGSWIIQSRPLVNGKEGKIFLDMKLVKQP
jgi:hypothetical protein